MPANNPQPNTQMHFLRRLAPAAGVFLGCLLVFCTVWFLRVRGNGDKSLSVKWSDAYDLTTPPVEQQISQQFSYDLDILGFALYFVVPGEQPEGALTLELFDADTGELLTASEGDMANIVSGQYAGLGVGRYLGGQQGRVYRLVLTPQYTGAGRLCLGYSAGAPQDGVLTADGQTLDGGLAMTVTYNRVGGFLTRFYLIVALLLSLTAAGATWACTASGLRLHRLTLLLVLAFGLLYTLVLPPYASPDEQYHINQSFTVAAKFANRFTEEDWHMGRVPVIYSYRRPSDENGILEQNDTTVFTWKIFAEQWRRTTSDAFDAHIETERPQVEPNNTFYLLSGTAVFLCFLLHLGYVPALLLGRVVNGVVYALLASWAVKRAPVGKPVFAVSALLPMSLHIGISFSRDSLLLGLSFAFTALCLEQICGSRPVDLRQLLPLFVIAFLLAPAKFVYLPLLLLFYRIPTAVLGPHAGRRRAAFTAVLAAALVLNSSLLFSMLGFPSAHAESGGPPSSAAEAAEPARSGEVTLVHTELPVEDTICYSPGYILTHPLDTAALVCNSVLEHGDHYIRTLVGGSLGYYSVDIAWGWVLLLYALLALAALPPDGETCLPGRERFWLGCAALGCTALTVAGCVTWTPTYYKTIYGLQGRYLLPMLPAALLALAPRRLRPAGDLTPVLLPGIALANAGVLLNAMLVIIAR